MKSVSGGLTFVAEAQGMHEDVDAKGSGSGLTKADWKKRNELNEGTCPGMNPM